MSWKWVDLKKNINHFRTGRTHPCQKRECGSWITGSVGNTTLTCGSWELFVVRGVVTLGPSSLLPKWLSQRFTHRTYTFHSGPTGFLTNPPPQLAFSHLMPWSVWVPLLCPPSSRINPSPFGAPCAPHLLWWPLAPYTAIFRGVSPRQYLIYLSALSP